MMNRRRFSAALAISLSGAWVYLRFVAGHTVTGIWSMIQRFLGIETRSVEEIKANARSVDYDELYRRINDYEGSAVVYEGTIADLPVTEESYQEILIALPTGEPFEPDMIYGYWRGNPYRREDDVRFWGLVRGLRTYNALAGELTVPEVDIADIEILES